MFLEDVSHKSFFIATVISSPSAEHIVTQQIFIEIIETLSVR